MQIHTYTGRAVVEMTPGESIAAQGPYMEGRAARKQGRTVNPYGHCSPQGVAWLTGYRDAGKESDQ